MCTIKELLLFLQTNCKEEALIYAEYSKTSLNKERYAINLIKQLSKDEIAFFFCQDYKSSIPSIKVKDAIINLQKYNENYYISFYHNDSKYYVIPDFSNNNEDNHVYLFVDRDDG